MSYRTTGKYLNEGGTGGRQEVEICVSININLKPQTGGGWLAVVAAYSTRKELEVDGGQLVE